MWRSDGQCRTLLLFINSLTDHFSLFSAEFEKGVAEGTVDPAFNPVVAVRLSVQKDSAVWAIVSEVCVLYLSYTPHFEDMDHLY